MTEQEVKAAVRLRDGLKCMKCGLSDEASRAKYGRSLDVHRTTPGSAYSLEPGVCVTLCQKCHGPEARYFNRMPEYIRSIGQAVREARVAAGLTLADVAERVGSTVPSLSRLEAGRSAPSILMALRLAEALEVPICSLLEKVGEPTKSKKKRGA